MERTPALKNDDRLLDLANESDTLHALERVALTLGKRLHVDFIQGVGKNFLRFALILEEQIFVSIAFQLISYDMPCII
ncbi:hypothetical protein KC799_25415 [candidate division KSB1 bacterium]|nr:hypothetical protein [candidate division KSB1 bacterium]